MNPYEGMFVVHNRDAQKDHTYLEEHVRALLDKVGATIVRLDKWDERQLAYEINGQRDGVFYLCYFEAKSESIGPLKREAELSELVLRLLVLRLDSIPSVEEVNRRSGRVREEESSPAEAESAPATEAATPPTSASAEA